MMDPGAPSAASSSSSRSSASPQPPSGPHPAHSNTHGPFVEADSAHDLDSFLGSFWTKHMQIVEAEEQDMKAVSLPLARIKKVMKSDEEVKMISQEVPIMFSKALFISELTCRAWLIAESHNRRTLQKSDVAAAIAMSDMFDFLIDIVPRDDDVDTDGTAPQQAVGEEAGGGAGQMGETEPAGAGVEVVESEGGLDPNGVGEQGAGWLRGPSGAGQMSAGHQGSIHPVQGMPDR